MAKVGVTSYTYEMLRNPQLLPKQVEGKQESMLESDMVHPALRLPLQIGPGRFGEGRMIAK